jgi:tetratricopeptide (TPR) repeat protein
MPPRPPGLSPGRRRPARLAAAALLLLLVGAGFHEAVRNGFIHLDDAASITNNPVVRGGLTARGALWALTATQTANWQPLTWISHLLDVELFGLRPAGHHGMSVLLHGANAILVFLALEGLTGAFWRSVVVAALFAIHPLHVESVAWASERKDLLSTFFALLALLAHLAYVRRPGRARRSAGPVLFAFALASKPMPVTLPFLLLLLDWWPLGRWSPQRGAGLPRRSWPGRLLPPPRLWLEKAPLFALAAASCVVTYLVQRGDGAMAWGRAIPWPTRFVNALVSYGSYLGATFWPRGLAPYYPYPGAHAWWTLAAALLALGLVTWLALRQAVARPFVLTGWLWYLGLLVPVIGLVQAGGQARADRYTYLPLVGVFLMVVWGLAQLTGTRPVLRRAAAGTTVALVALLIVLTRAQVRLWRSSVSLFTHTLETTTGNDVAHNCLGVALAQEGDFGQAIAHFRASLHIEPASAETLFNLGMALELQGNRAAAADSFERALALRPDLERARQELRRLRASGDAGAPGRNRPRGDAR